MTVKMTAMHLIHCSVQLLSCNKTNHTTMRKKVKHKYQYFRKTRACENNTSAGTTT